MVTQFEKKRERRAEVNNLCVCTEKSQNKILESKVEHTGDYQGVIERVSRDGLKPSKRRRIHLGYHHRWRLQWEWQS